MIVGLVGCGRWGRHILRDFRELGCDVHVVARSPASVGRASEGGASRIVDTVAGLNGVDGIVVATPTLASAGGRSTTTSTRDDTPGELPVLAERRAFVSHLGGGPAPRSSAAEGALVEEHIAALCALAS